MPPKKKSSLGCLAPKAKEEERQSQGTAGTELGDTDEQTSKSQPSKKHIWKQTNPLEFPPHLYTRDLFRVNNPFICFSESLPSFDKIGSPNMRKDTLKVAAMKMSMTTRNCESCYKNPTNEVNGQITHASYLETIQHLTKPSPRTYARFGKRPKLDDDDGNSDILVNAEQIDDKTESNESIELKHEESVEQGRIDFKISVYDGRVKKRKRATSHIDPWTTELIVEAKWKLSADDIYQAAAYGRSEAFENLAKGKVSPIYLQVWSQYIWRYGILDVYGYIEIKSGAITAESMERLENHEKERWCRVMPANREFKKSIFTLDELNAMLAEETEFLRVSYSKASNPIYPDGKYIVGYLYKGLTDLQLPTFQGRGTCWTFGAQTFYEALLRIVIGEKVLQWSPDDVNKAAKIREDLITQEMLMAFDEGHDHPDKGCSSKS